MNCYFCNGKMNLKDSPFMVEHDAGIIVINDVPTDICEKCGQRSYRDEVAQRVNSLRLALRSEGLEVAVMRYSS
jgi:YgiT-type zinc finger domain-containing protein